MEVREDKKNPIGAQTIYVTNLLEGRRMAEGTFSTLERERTQAGTQKKLETGDQGPEEKPKRTQPPKRPRGANVPQPSPHPPAEPPTPLPDKSPHLLPLVALWATLPRSRRNPSTHLADGAPILGNRPAVWRGQLESYATPSEPKETHLALKSPLTSPQVSRSTTQPNCLFAVPGSVCSSHAL